MTSGTMLTPATVSATAGRSRVTMRMSQRPYVRAVVLLDAAVIALAVGGGYLARFGGDERAPAAPRSRTSWSRPPLVLTWLVSLKVLRCYDDRVLGYGADEYRRVSGGELAARRRHRHRRLHRRRRRLPGLPRHLLRARHRRPGRSPASPPASGCTGPADRGAGWSRRVLVVGRHRARAGAGAHAAPGAVRRLPGGRRLHPGRAARAGAAAARRRAGGRVVPRHPGRRATAIGADTVAVTASGELTATRLRRLGLAAGGHRHRPGGGAGADRRRRPAHPHPAGRRAAADPRRGARVPGRPQAGQGLRRPVDRRCWCSCCALPLMVVIALAIKLDSRGPVLFRQTRVGQGGRGVRRLQVPHHGGQRRRAPGRAGRPQRDRRPDVQDARRPAGHPGRAAACASGRWTSCRSWSTCCSGR